MYLYIGIPMNMTLCRYYCTLITNYSPTQCILLHTLSGKSGAHIGTHEIKRTEGLCCVFLGLPPQGALSSDHRVLWPMQSVEKPQLDYHRGRGRRGGELIVHQSVHYIPTLSSHYCMSAAP